MPIHSRETIRTELEADIYGSIASDTPVPKYRMREQELRPDEAAALVRDELFLDGNAKQNLATFCSTWLDPEVHRLMDASINKNMIDKDEYPATAELENRCVHMLAELWRSPKAADTIGCSTTGSSEACMLGGLALKWKWRERIRAAGKPTDKPNLVTGPVQVCWHKFARYFDVELREIPIERGRLGMTPDEVIKRVDENTIGVMPTFGVTFTGQYEPVLEVATALDRLAREKSLDVPMHVDAASGGFIAPFIEPELVWDFRIPRVRSINASGHKYGLAPLGVGWVVWRERVDLPEELIFYVNYLGGNMPTFALNFSRPGGQIISQVLPTLAPRAGRLPPHPEKLLRRGPTSRARSPYARPLRTFFRRGQPERHPRGVLHAADRSGPRILPVRSFRPPARPRVAGRGIHDVAEHHRRRRDPFHRAAWL